MSQTAGALPLIPNNYLKFGIFLAPFHDLNENPTLALQRDLQLLEWLDQLGYDEAWVGEHHSGGFEIITCPEIFVAAAGERTKNIQLGTGVVSLPYHNPYTVAGRVTMLDHLMHGRFLFGVGPGSLVGDAYRMGINPADQRRRMNESLDVIVRLLDGETVSEKTDWFELRDARLQLPPYRQPRTEMAVAGARSPVGALAAGKHGIGLLSIGGTNDEAMAAHARNWGLYEEAAEKNGKSADRANWRLVTMMHIAETREKARENIAFGLEPFAKYFREIATFPIVPEDISNPYEFLTENRLAVIGTPDDAIEFIETLLEGAGGFGVLMQLAHNWADWDATKRHYELMARYVFPHFQRSNLQRVASYDHSYRNHDVFISNARSAVQSEIDRYQKSKEDEAAE